LISEKWRDKVLQLNTADFQDFPKLVSDYIHEGQWTIPQYIANQFPTLRPNIFKVIIPFEESANRLIWKHTTNGDLSLKDSYSFIKQPSTTLHWAKHIWRIDIPPSKSLVA